ncbi:MAG: hypothetical protein V3W43_18185 [Desulfatiglandaceae bacterium]
MKRACKIISFLAVFLLTVPAIWADEQFKITRVYDGGTVKAEGYDPQCFG